jgi:hypothetical protein
MILLAGFLTLTTVMAAQKPVIDLIPSSHQIMNPEAIVDTSVAIDSLVRKNAYVHPPADQNENATIENMKKERRQIGPSMDSLFRKPETRNTKSTRTTGSISLYIRKLNPVKFFISIIALNNNL